jgi:type IV secretory pathway TrbD component
VILGFVVSVWVIVLIAFVVLSVAVRGTSIRARAKPSARQINNEIGNEQFGTE